MVDSLNSYFWSLFGYNNQEGDKVLYKRFPDNTDSSFRADENAKSSDSQQNLESKSGIISASGENETSAIASNEIKSESNGETSVNFEPQSAKADEITVIEPPVTKTKKSAFKFKLDGPEDPYSDGVCFSVNPIAMLPKQNNMRRNSKRFVIGEEIDEEAGTSEAEVLLNIPNPEWLRASSRLRPGTTLT